MRADTSHDWFVYERVGEIECRSYRKGDELNERISFSLADREEAAFRGAFDGMIACNPMNREDQWFIAADYFAKNYRIKQVSP